MKMQHNLNLHCPGMLIIAYIITLKFCKVINMEVYLITHYNKLVNIMN